MVSDAIGTPTPWYVPYLFLLPGLALYTLWMVYPLCTSCTSAFRMEHHARPGQHVHLLQNYQTILNDSNFWLALRNTVQYTAITVIGQMALGLAVALLVHRVTVAQRVFRAIYYLPVVTSWVVVSFLFQFLFSSDRAG